MAFIRACSYITVITPPKSPDSYTKILVVFQQDEENLVTLTLDSPGIECDDTRIIVKLTQEETKQFKAGIPALVQVRCYGATYDAPGCAVRKIDVYPALDDRILGGE